MITKELIDEVKVSQAVTVTAGAAGTTDINGATLDMSGFEGVLMVVRMGAITSGAVTSIKAQQDSASGMGSAADLADSAITIADDDDEKTFIIPVHKPRERYVRLVVDRGTQNAVVSSAEYIQYGAATLPVTQGSNVTVNTDIAISPAEGTA